MTGEEDVSFSEEQFLEEGYMRALTSRLYAFANIFEQSGKIVVVLTEEEMIGG